MGDGEGRLSRRPTDFSPTLNALQTEGPCVGNAQPSSGGLVPVPTLLSKAGCEAAPQARWVFPTSRVRRQVPGRASGHRLSEPLDCGLLESCNHPSTKKRWNPFHGFCLPNALAHVWLHRGPPSMIFTYFSKTEDVALGFLCSLGWKIRKRGVEKS